ncbi:hypothetical protein SAMN05421663_101544 [Terribacillus halophilus]|uniref:Uncharacterized protein n=1 Tax=Terribacillus halophilus TaxID=361279 RepID=A0A1G6JC73_9BACI|nr:hypothetical protein [Terribacillus halophilus]SDC16243.1 hypothetical protein SAMN05421663_101544 [Terribacillus halophilus]
MSNETREYRTGQGIPQMGVYTCQSGEKVAIKAYDAFPHCAALVSYDELPI